MCVHILRSISAKKDIGFCLHRRDNCRPIKLHVNNSRHQTTCTWNTHGKSYAKFAFCIDSTIWTKWDGQIRYLQNFVWDLADVCETTTCAEILPNSRDFQRCQSVCAPTWSSAPVFERVHPEFKVGYFIFSQIVFYVCSIVGFLFWRCFFANWCLVEW